MVVSTCSKYNEIRNLFSSFMTPELEAVTTTLIRSLQNIDSYVVSHSNHVAYYAAKIANEINCSSDLCFNLFNQQILDMTLYHHERFDGTGYPSNLKGEQIPFAARILSLADSFDAMTTNRVYRKEFDLQYAINQIHENRGAQFDPDLADVFLKIIERECSHSFDTRFQTMECNNNGQVGNSSELKGSASATWAHC